MFLRNCFFFFQKWSEDLIVRKLIFITTEMMILLNRKFSVTFLNTKAAERQLVKMMIVIQVFKDFELKVVLISESSFTLSFFFSVRKLGKL